MPSGPLQVLKVAAVTVAIAVPDRPLPPWTVALVVDEAQVRVAPDRVSFSVVVPAVPVTGPPGVTVQSAAKAGVPTPTTKAAVMVARHAAEVLRIVSPLPGGGHGLCAPVWKKVITSTVE